jgi:predicted nucleic acid-binding protein
VTWWRKRRLSREAPDVKTKLAEARATQREAQEELTRALEISDAVDEITAESSQLAERNGFADMILDTFQLRNP